MAWKPTSPIEQSWLIRWTSSRRRLALKPTSRSAGRLCSRLPILKSRVSLTVVSVVSNACCAILGRERMWQSPEPLPKQCIDVRGGKLVADSLELDRVLARQDPVVEGLEAYLPVLELPFHVLVSVDAELCVVRKVRTELQEERPEIAIQCVEVILVHHRC